MNRRFDRLGALDQVVLVTLITSISMFLFPFSVAAQTSNQTIVFEIKTLQIPNMTPASTTIETPDKPSAPVAPVAKTITVAKTSYKVPPKTVGDARVYMHEPEIRAYVCPKLGDRCNTFIAILAAENGTHECTRDNRGLNKNGSIDIGLAQINWSPRSPYSFEQLQDCKFNLDIALQKVASRGFQPWAAYNKGAYKKHLAAVLASASIVAAPAPVPVTENSQSQPVANPDLMVTTMVSTKAVDPTLHPVPVVQ
jgi:hypothetical protein